MANIKPSVHPKLVKAQMLAQTGKFHEALVLLDKVCRKDKRNADANFIKGSILGQTGDLEGAAKSLRRATIINPRHTLAYFNLGNVLTNLGEIKQAVSAYTSAHKLEPKKPEIVNVLARSLANTGLFKEAIELYKRNLKLQPHNPDVNANIATSYFLNGELESAAKYYRRAIEQQKNASYYDGLGAALCQQGKYTEAVEAHRNALMLQPDTARFHSNLLLSMNYLPEKQQNDLIQEHKRWVGAHSIKTGLLPQYKNTPEQGRRLRVGYVSPDFRTHSVAYFFEPLLENHDKESIETYCYACTLHQDETTGRLQKAADHWRNIAVLDDAQAITQIRKDEIDILIDLSGHTAKNRLPIFTAKPAPVQVTWLGYPATTGLETIDYRISDEVVDLPENAVLYTEQLVQLPGCFLCYKPPLLSPSVQPAPVEKNGFITFGSFNNLAKINEAVVRLWSELMNAVQGSRLLIKNPSLTDSATAERYFALFEKYGISADRIDLMGLAPTLEEHLNTYSLIDIALDTFPYNGTTTSCEALHMGVPVITLSGKLHASRVGESLLTILGQAELVAKTTEGYVAIAKELAEDSVRVSDYRNILRTCMSDSSLCDGRAFAQKMEQAYRDMWRTWCASQHV